MKIIIAVLLIVHGLIVAGQSSASFHPTGGVQNPAWLNWWPAGLGQSWLLSGVETTLVVRFGGLVWLAAGLALIASGLALLKLLIPFEHWRVLALTGAILSLAMLLLYLHPFYVIGIASSAVLLAALFFKNWTILKAFGL